MAIIRFFFFFFLLAARWVAAHFKLESPAWQADTLANKSYSQWVYPCAGVPADLAEANVTAWPLTGGSLKLDLHHPWTYIFVNLGLGNNVSNFNYSLTQPFWNETGNGTLCVPKVSLPADLNVTDGTNASVQVVTVGETGAALYNVSPLTSTSTSTSMSTCSPAGLTRDNDKCANIVFRSNATALSGSDCVTSAGVSYSPVNQEVNGSTINSNSSTGQAGKSAASEKRLDWVVIMVALGTVGFAMGMGF